MGILADGERAVATTNPQLCRPHGPCEQRGYLASPAVAAASAVLGKIAGPEEL